MRCCLSSGIARYQINFTPSCSCRGLVDRVVIWPAKSTGAPFASNSLLFASGAAKFARFAALNSSGADLKVRALAKAADRDVLDQRGIDGDEARADQ